MNKLRIKTLAHGWYHGPRMPSTAEAADHFRSCAVRDPVHSAEYGEAMALFLRDKDRQRADPTYTPQESYTPAAAHVDASEFRARLNEYREQEAAQRIGPPLPNDKP